MEATNEIIQRSDPDVVRMIVMEWANSRLQPRDQPGAQEWQDRGVLHGKMVLLGRARPEILPGRVGYFTSGHYTYFSSPDKPTDYGVRLTGTQISSAGALLRQFRRRTDTLAWKRRPRLAAVWNRREIRTLKAAMALVVKAQFLNAAYSNGIAKMTQLVSCVKELCQLAEYLPEPDRDLLDFLSVAQDHVRAAYFPWIDREVLEVLA